MLGNMLGSAIDELLVAAERKNLIQMVRHLTERVEALEARLPQPLEDRLVEASLQAYNTQDLNRAKDLLINLLHDGAASYAHVLQQASVRGVTRDVLEEAKEELGVVAERAGRGPGGTWFWRLPHG